MKGKKVKPFTMTLLMFLFAALFYAAAGSVALAGDVVVICNNSVSADGLDKDEIKNIFLGKKSSWGDGSRIQFVILKSGSVHADFLKQYIGKTPIQFKNYWKKMVFSGKGKAPKSFDDEKSLAAYVAGTNGAVGYIGAGADAGGAKVVAK